MKRLLLTGILTFGFAFSAELTAPVYKVWKVGGFEIVQVGDKTETGEVSKEFVGTYKRVGEVYEASIKGKRYRLTPQCVLKSPSPEGFMEGSDFLGCPVDPEKPSLVEKLSPDQKKVWKRISVKVDYDRDGKTGEPGYFLYDTIGGKETYVLVVYDPSTKYLKYIYAYEKDPSKGGQEYLLLKMKVEEETLPPPPPAPSPERGNETHKLPPLPSVLKKVLKQDNQHKANATQSQNGTTGGK